MIDLRACKNVLVAVLTKTRPNHLQLNSRRRDRLTRKQTYIYAIRAYWMHRFLLFSRHFTHSIVKPNCLDTKAVTLVAESILADVKDLPTRGGPFALELRNDVGLLAIVLYARRHRGQVIARIQPNKGDRSLTTAFLLAEHEVCPTWAQRLPATLKALMH